MLYVKNKLQLPLFNQLDVQRKLMDNKKTYINDKEAEYSIFTNKRQNFEIQVELYSGRQEKNKEITLKIESN